MKKMNGIACLTLFSIVLIFISNSGAVAGKEKEKKENLKSKISKTFEKARRNIKSAADEAAEKAEKGVKGLKEGLSK